MSAGAELSVPETLVDIRSGEVLPATPDNAVEMLAVVRETRSRLMLLVKDCEAVLLRESARRGTKTMHFPDGTATITGGQEVEYDQETLAELLTLGLPEDRWNELVTAKVEYKVNAAVAKQLEASNEEYAHVVRRARTIVPKPWRVSLR